MLISSRTFSVGLIFFLLASATAACNKSTTPVAISPSPELSNQVIPVEETRVITVDQATLRAGPGVSYDKVGSLSKGAEIMVTGKSVDGDWYRLKLPNGSPEEAWLFVEFTIPSEPTPAEPTQTENAKPVATSVITATLAVIVPTQTPPPPQWIRKSIFPLFRSIRLRQV